MNDDHEPRDAALDALLGRHSTETPPAHIDAAILAAAHRAVANGPRPALATHAWRWWMPLAAAAAIGAIIVGVLRLAPSIVEEPPHVISDLPAGASSVKAPLSSMEGAQSPNPPKETAAASTQPNAAAAADARAKPGSAPGSPAKVARPASRSAQGPAKRDEPRQDRAIDAPAEMQKNQAGAAVGALAPSPGSPPASSPQSPLARAPGLAAPQRARAPDARDEAGARPHTVDQWIARIRTLRDRGDVDEAKRALADFRAAFSDADVRLPADLREWVYAPR